MRSIIRRAIYSKFAVEDLAIVNGGFVSGYDSDAIRVKFCSFDGYAFAFPRADLCSVGVGWRGSEPGRRADALKTLQEFVGAMGPAVKWEERYAALIPCVRDEETWRLPLNGDRWAIVGDAAGQVHPIRGEGILYAMWAARLLSEAVLRGETQEYDDHWREAFGVKLFDKNRSLWKYRAPLLTDFAFRLARYSTILRKELYVRCQHRD